MILGSGERFEEEFPDMFSALRRGLDLAAEHDSMVQHLIFNTGLGRWQNLGYFHPDETSTNVFGERQRWTGDRFYYWEKTDLEPYDPFKKNRT